MKREQWGTRTGFILAAVGSAIGLGNIWRFPYMAYENGGGAFFIPYLFAMLTAGIPFMIMEFTLGHKFRSSSPGMFKKINDKFEWLGWFQVMIAAGIGVYYIAIIGWAISYIPLAFTQGWGDDPDTFFYKEYLQLGDNAPTKLGSIQLHIVVPMLIGWAVTFAALYGGIKGGIERAGKIMLPVLFVLILALIGRMIFLPGALDGLNYLFKPDFSALGNTSVWAAAYGQMFFTLSVGFAIMLSYSSYLPEKSDINNNAIMTVLLNCGFSMIAGVLIFSILGYMAQKENIALTDVATESVGLAFVTIPAAINLLPIPYILGPIFFLALVVAGFSSHISILEAVVTAFIDKLGWSRKKAVTIVCGTATVISLAFATNGGLLLLDLVDYFLNHIALLFSCLVELILIGYYCKLSSLRTYANNISEFKVGRWLELCVKLVSPLVIAIILEGKIRETIRDGYGGYSPEDLFALGWRLLGVMLIIAIIINLAKNKEV